MTCYDTGTHENHMSYTKAVEMGYTINLSNSLGACFELPNGKIIRALGYVDVAVQFAIRMVPEAASIVCRFNVFEQLARPVLIGMTFLRATETITKCTSRLVELPETLKRPLRSYSMGNATNQVKCIINGIGFSASADTGSDIALISGKFARQRGFQILDGCEELELADGSLEYTSGFADVEICVLNSALWETKSASASTRRWRLKSGTKVKINKIRFHVLESLRINVLLDEENSDILDVFQDGIARFMSAAPSVLPSISPIIRLGSVEAAITRATDKMNEKTKHLGTSIRSKCTSVLSTSKSSSTSTCSPSAATPSKQKPFLSPIIAVFDKPQ